MKAIEFLGGDIRIWIEQEAIHIIAGDIKHFDPVEIDSDMARKIANILLNMSDQLDQ